MRACFQDWLKRILLLSPLSVFHKRWVSIASSATNIDVGLVEIDGVDDSPGKHVNRSIIFGGVGPYISLPSHSFLAYLGPQTYILMLDCRWVVFVSTP